MKEKTSRVIGVLLLSEILFVVLLGLILYVEKSNKFEYCKLYETSIENGNKWVLKYWKSFKNGFDTVIVSPLSVQYALYQDYVLDGVEDVDVFRKPNNGYLSWYDSGVLDASFNVFYPTSDVEVLSTLGECEYREGYVYSVFKCNERVLGAVANGDKILYRGMAGVDGDIVRLNLSNNYELYLGGYSEDVKDTNVTVRISPYIWQAYGTVDGILSDMNADGYPMMAFMEFGLRLNDYTVSHDSYGDADFVFDDNYEFYIRNKGSGAIVAVGKR